MDQRLSLLYRHKIGSQTSELGTFGRLARVGRRPRQLRRMCSCGRPGSLVDKRAEGASVDQVFLGEDHTEAVHVSGPW